MVESRGPEDLHATCVRRRLECEPRTAYSQPQRLDARTSRAGPQGEPAIVSAVSPPGPVQAPSARAGLRGVARHPRAGTSRAPAGRHRRSCRRSERSVRLPGLSSSWTSEANAFSPAVCSIAISSSTFAGSPGRRHRRCHDMTVRRQDRAEVSRLATRPVQITDDLEQIGDRKLRDDRIASQPYEGRQGRPARRREPPGADLARTPRRWWVPPLGTRDPARRRGLLHERRHPLRVDRLRRDVREDRDRRRSGLALRRRATRNTADSRLEHRRSERDLHRRRAAGRRRPLPRRCRARRGDRPGDRGGRPC